ncbi:MAG: Crp/Fnr family transcriptional regulator [Anaerolineales bacterium]|nr:Crp/Fnr family transcriptional regulator [Anaerolineales bacterium]
MRDLTELIDRNPVFSHLGEREQAALLRSATSRSYRRGEFIAHYGEIWPYLFLVARGAISAVKLSLDGRTLGALKLVDGDLYLGPWIFDDGPLPASFEAKTACTIYLWPRQDVVSVLRKNPEALWQACLLLSQRIRQASGFVEELAFQPVAARVAHLLLDQFKGGVNLHVPRELTLDEMGQRTGTTPVMVCKVLSRFAQEGLITVGRTQFSLLDATRLEKISRSR